MNEFAKYTQGGGDFLRKEDVPQPILVTIRGTSEHTWPDDNKTQLVLEFGEQCKPLCCNTTNSRILKAIFEKTHPGVELSVPSQLVGVPIVVFNDMTVQMHGQVTGGLRVRMPDQAPVQPQAGYTVAGAPQQVATMPPQPMGDNRKAVIANQSDPHPPF
jgi:hypothetical protein